MEYFIYTWKKKSFGFPAKLVHLSAVNGFQMLSSRNATSFAKIMSGASPCVSINIHMQSLSS